MKAEVIALCILHISLVVAE